MSIEASAHSDFNRADPSVPSSRLESPDGHREKKKRRLEDSAEDGASVREKKKKRKKSRDQHIHAGDDSAKISALSDVAPIKKKKKKKCKKKDVEQSKTSLPQATPGYLPTLDFPATDMPNASDSYVAEENMQSPVEPHFDPPSQQHYMSFPFAPLPDGASPYVSSSMIPQSPLFPSSGSLPFSEIAFGSNDDVLRALQALDMSKITTVLRTLGEAAAASNDLTGSVMHASTVPVNHVPHISSAMLGAPPSETRGVTGSQHAFNITLPLSEQHANPEHAYILANKWLNTTKLAELVKTEGLVYKKGKFSAIEEQQLRQAIDNFRAAKGLTDDQMLELIYPKSEKSRDNAFWSELTAAISQRPIIAVYHHVRRTYHPMKKLGRWDPEQDALLKQAVTDLGQQWEKVSLRVGRMSSDCRDRYRNHIVDQEVRVTGPWSQGEEEELTSIVTDMTVKQGKDIDNDVFWGRVSELMGGKRGRQQCRIKWTDALCKTVKNRGTKPRWNQQDAYILVHKVDSLNVRDDTEIDWKTLPDHQWNLWSAHTLQRRWLTMKRSIKGHEEMSHQDIMDILRVKKAQMPTLVPSRKRKITSAAIVVEDAFPDTPVLPEGSGVGFGNQTDSGTFTLNGDGATSPSGSD